MKFSLSTLGCPDYSFEQIIELAKKVGYTGVEMRIYRMTEDLRTLDEFRPERLGAVRRLFHQAGLEITCVSSSARFAYPDPENLKEQLQLAEDYMKIASELECPYIRVFGGPYPVNFTGRPQSEPFIEAYRQSLPPEKVRGLTREACDEAVMECLGKTGEAGRQYGVMPLMETHDDFCSGAVVCRLIEGCGSDNVGILWDCLHPFRYGLDLRETYEAVRDKIHHVHMKDAGDLTPWGFTPALVGDGEMDLQTAVDILRENDYREYVCFEWEKLWHPQIAEAEIACPQFMESVLKMLEK